MQLPEAWKELGVKPGATRGEIKKAYRRRITEVHPDVTGDDGSLLQRLREAYALLERIEDPTAWDARGFEEGLPAWATGLMQGVRWTDECPSFAAFLEKPDQKALAVGEFSEKEGVRPWAAAWGKYSQAEANAEALRVCRQFGVRCRLVYVGSGTARARSAVHPSAGQDEKAWWANRFQNGGGIPGFGWMPIIDPAKERLVGYKTVSVGDTIGSEARVRVPVFKLKTGSTPYYYSPQRPKERVHMQNRNFKHVQNTHTKAGKLKQQKRMRDAVAQGTQQHNTWRNTSPF